MMNRDIATHKKLNNLEPQLEEVTYRYNRLQNQYRELATAFRELQANRDSREVRPSLAPLLYTLKKTSSMPGA